MNSRLLRVVGLSLVLLSGCAAPQSEGTEASARTYLAGEFQNWMANQPNSVSTMQSRITTALPPISYDIRSIVPDKPDVLAYDKSQKLPDDWKTWPAYRVNVAIEFRSTTDEPMQKVATYTLTWNSHEKRWYTQERFL